MLEHPGIFVARNVVKKVSARNRSEAQEKIDQILNALVDERFGVWLSDRRIRCYLKTMPMDKAKLRRYGLNVELYNEANSKEDILLSNNQKKCFC